MDDGGDWGGFDSAGSIDTGADVVDLGEGADVADSGGAWESDATALQDSADMGGDVSAAADVPAEESADAVGLDLLPRASERWDLEANGNDIDSLPFTIHPNGNPEILPSPEVEPESIPTQPERPTPQPPEGWRPGGPEGGF